MSNLLPVGSTLHNSKYRIDKYLASGGFGNTYLAFDNSFGMTVAIKEFFIAGINDRAHEQNTVSISNAANQPVFDRMRNQFRKEAIRLRKLHSQHIVRVQDLFDENETSYYVMDLIDGTSLSAVMKKEGKPLREESVKGILPQIIDALDEIHHHGIWHLDIKPANIMRDNNGNITIIDFGASKQFTQDERKTTTSTQLSYTPGYAAPELIEGNTNRIGPWTDFYALGATLYNLLTMNTPPQASDVSEEGEKAFVYNVPVSQPMRQLILWLMAPVIKQRPMSLEDMKGFAARYLYGEAPTADVTSSVGKGDTPSSDDGDITVITTPTRQSPANAHEGKGTQPPQNAKQEQHSTVKEEPKKSNKTLLVTVVVIAVVALIVALVLIFGPKTKDPIYYEDGDYYGNDTEAVEAAEDADAELAEKVLGSMMADTAVAVEDATEEAYMELPETMNCSGYLSDGSRQWPIRVDLHYVSYTGEVWGTYHNNSTSIDLDGNYEDGVVTLESYNVGEYLKLVLTYYSFNDTFDGTAYGQSTLQCHLSFRQDKRSHTK